MSFESAFIELLTNQTLVVNQVSDQIYYEIAPRKSTFPQIVFSVISENRYHHTRGSSGLVTTRVQVDCWAQSGLLAGKLAEAIRVSIDGYTGIVDDVEFKQCFLKDRRSSFDLSANGEEENHHRKILDFSIGYHESIPFEITGISDWTDSSGNNLVTDSGDRLIFKQAI